MYNRKIETWDRGQDYQAPGLSHGFYSPPPDSLPLPGFLPFQICCSALHSYLAARRGVIDFDIVASRSVVQFLA